MQPFSSRLAQRVAATDSRVCLGIDPRPEAHPSTHPHRVASDPAKVARGIVHYFREILAATHELVACVKPQSAFFERLGIPGLIALAQIIADAKALELPVVLDAKRGDIGSTAEAYAEAFLGDGVFGSDALTVNPYLGMDSLQPFADAAHANGRGIFVLVKTSNPGSGDIQDIETRSGQPLHELVAAKVTAVAAGLQGSDGLSPIGAVVGATYPGILERLRHGLPHSWLLVPGYGAQGATAGDVQAAFLPGGRAAIVSASRSLTYTTTGDDYAAGARQAVERMRDAINAAIG